MQQVRTVLLGVAMIFGLVLMARAADEDKTIKGTVTCAKCDLKETKTCQTVVVEEKDGKKVVYYFDPDSSKKYHKDICTTPTKGTVTGTVSEKDKKMIIKVKEAKLDK